MVAELLLEIGTEEIPSGYLKNGLKEFRLLTEACLRENRIEMAGGIYTYGTPRRLVLIGKAISGQQEDLVKEVTGPPKNVAYDEKGAPTKAALGFAGRQGIPVEALEVIDTPKGEYLYAKQQIPGKRTFDILADAIPKLIADIPWPKSMRWGTTGFPFVRPIHWVLAILNGETIPFKVADVTSGNKTWGHRFMGPEVFEVSSVQDYLRKMENSYIIIDQREREEAVEKKVSDAADTVGGKPGRDPDLVSTVANLVEYPSAVCGGFDKAFLKLPAPVLITAMKEHQKYFAIYDEKSRLMPNFVAVNNTITRHASIVRKGHERVLRARLADAAFFFEEDKKRALKDYLDDLKGVVYQADLGTSHAKVLRFSRLAEYICEKALPDKAGDVKTAAMLCKCDLVTHMVTEFPSLQGVMGKEYARIERYPEGICEAIYEHYLPIRAADRLPASQTGAAVGLADRMDTIVGCFAVGLEPSGSADPFGLRRRALAIIRIMENMGWDLSIREFIDKSISILNEEITFERDVLFSGVINFFRERYKQMMLRAGYESDLIEAAISVEFDQINQLPLRIEQLKRFSSESEGFRELTLTFKRVVNILKKQEQPFKVDSSLFVEACESILWETFQNLKDDIYQHLEKRDYYEAMKVIVRFRTPVDKFFDGVEVLTKESRAIRENRVGLLQRLSHLFLSVADFSKFSI